MSRPDLAVFLFDIFGDTPGVTELQAALESSADAPRTGRLADWFEEVQADLERDGGARLHAFLDWLDQRLPHRRETVGRLRHDYVDSGIAPPPREATPLEVDAITREYRAYVISRVHRQLTVTLPGEGANLLGATWWVRLRAALASGLRVAEGAVHLVAMQSSSVVTVEVRGLHARGRGGPAEEGGDVRSDLSALDTSALAREVSAVLDIEEVRIDRGAHPPSPSDRNQNLIAMHEFLERAFEPGQLRQFARHHLRPVVFNAIRWTGSLQECVGAFLEELARENEDVFPLSLFEALAERRENRADEIRRLRERFHPAAKPPK